MRSVLRSPLFHRMDSVTSELKPRSLTPMLTSSASMGRPATVARASTLCPRLQGTDRDLADEGEVGANGIAGPALPRLQEPEHLRLHRGDQATDRGQPAHRRVLLRRRGRDVRVALASGERVADRDDQEVAD